MIKKIYKEGLKYIHAKNVEGLRENHPLQYLFWECTLNCNFFCEHCGSSAGRKIHKDELTTEEIKAAFKDVADNFDPRNITIAVTGGEPLLRQDLFEVMKYATDLGFGWGMVSNGYLLTKEVAQKLKAAGMKTVVISIDELGVKHDDFRKMPGAYDHAIAAIKNLADENFLQNLQITTTITKKSVNDLEAMCQEFSKLPIDSWRVMNIDPIGRAEGNNDLLLDKKGFQKMMNFILEKRKTSKIDITYDCSGYLGDLEGEVRGNLYRCTTGITTGSILHNGDIFVCPNVPRHKELIQGNVKKDSFSTVWNEKFEVFRDKNRTKCDKCEKCESWEYCLGNGYHLWDKEKGEPKICHLEMLDMK